LFVLVEPFKNEFWLLTLEIKLFSKKIIKGCNFFCWAASLFHSSWRFELNSTMSIMPQINCGEYICSH
jgi:hypothetical protein